MIELLRAAAEADPGQLAVITPDGGLSYRELSVRAEAAASSLLARGIERFAILDDDAARIWALLAAASHTGAEACVYPALTAADGVAALRAQLGHDTLVTPHAVPGPGVVPPAELFAFAGVACPAADPSPRPLLVLTSGTSGHTRAARHDWSRLLRVTDGIKDTPQHRWLLAYGLNQFGGLQILLHVAAARATLVAAESLQPRAALAAMREHGVTHASGTPTFWRFLLAEMRADGRPVPPLRQVTLGGEAVPAALLGQIRAAFPGARVSQIYGATETGRNITVRDGLPGLPLSVLEGDGEITYKIVDDELHVRSASSMLGYYGEDPMPTGEWRPTGDLVEVVGGRIIFRGRRAEVINVGGVKVHPLPIEELVSGVEGVALAHAYGRPSAIVGNIVALDVVPTADADEQQLRAAIRDACADLPPAARPRSVNFAATMATQGGKVWRGKP